MGARVLGWRWDESWLQSTKLWRSVAKGRQSHHPTILPIPDGLLGFMGMLPPGHPPGRPDPLVSQCIPCAWARWRAREGGFASPASQGGHDHRPSSSLGPDGDSRESLRGRVGSRPGPHAPGLLVIRLTPHDTSNPFPHSHQVPCSKRESGWISRACCIQSPPSSKKESRFSLSVCNSRWGGHVHRSAAALRTEKRSIGTVRHKDAGIHRFPRTPEFYYAMLKF